MQVEVMTPAIATPPGPPRSPGIHASAVIRAIAVQNKVLRPEYVESLDLIDRTGPDFWQKIDPVGQLRMSMGLAWEQWYIQTQLPNVVHQPGEMCVEGMYMTHDGESLETILSQKGQEWDGSGNRRVTLVGHEVKLTYKSYNTIKNIQTQWMWLSQIKTYCKGLGTLDYWLHVLCVCGDYSYPISPLIRIFKLRFTQLEIDDNWELVTTYVRHWQQQQAEDMMRDTE